MGIFVVIVFPHTGAVTGTEPGHSDEFYKLSFVEKHKIAIS